MVRYLGAEGTFDHWPAQRSRSFDVNDPNRLFFRTGGSTAIQKAVIMNTIVRLSARIAKIETAALKVLVASVLVLMVVNVACRALNSSLYWADELAINLMVIFAFIGSSLMFAQRRNFAVTLVSDAVSDKNRRRMSIFVQCVNVLFALFLGYATWLWFDPLTLATNGFQLQGFFEETYNSVYREVTNTIGVRRVWFFLVMPVFAFTLLVHSLACLIQDISNQNTLDMSK
jgi:TRAP-type C4-dicarboxylate transport system permease small subunit